MFKKTMKYNISQNNILKNRGLTRKENWISFSQNNNGVFGVPSKKIVLLIKPLKFTFK